MQNYTLHTCKQPNFHQQYQDTIILMTYSGPIINGVKKNLKKSSHNYDKILRLRPLFHGRDRCGYSSL